MKKLFFLFLALVAIATGASAATDYGFKMLNVSINSDNYQSQSAGKAWSYDPSANVLHLKDGIITTTISSAIMIQIDGDVNPTLTIQVDGNCSIGGTFSNALYFTGNGKHTICGNGTLTMMSRLTDSQVISAKDNTSLTIKDVTINIEAYGQVPVGLISNNFYEVILDYCEMNIKTSGHAWMALGNHGVNPVMKKCYISNGHFFGGTAFGSSETGSNPNKEVYIKRAICVVDVSIDEPAVGNSPSFDCTSNSEEYYVPSVEWHGIREGGLDFVLPDGYTYQAGEAYSVYAILYTTDGHRFADNKEDVTAYVNGKEAEIYNIGSGFVTIKYTFPELVDPRFNLWVGGVKVNKLNKDDVLGNRIVSYDPETKTLSLKSASIHGQGRANDAATGYGAGIYSEVDGLTIDVASGGVEVIGADDCHGIFLWGNTTIKGEGTISGKGYIGVFMGSNSADLTVDGNVMLQAEGSKTYGLGGYARTFVGKANYYTTLTVKGTAKVLAKGVSKSIGDWKDLVLEDNHAITSPTGAVWNADKHAVCDASGNPIAGEWVLITTKTANPADVNKDGTVDSADIVAVIKEMPDGDKKADVNGDTVIDSADIVAVIKAMK